MKNLKICLLSEAEFLEPLWKINERQVKHDFSLEGVPAWLLRVYKKHRWLTDFGVVTAEGETKLSKSSLAH